MTHPNANQPVGMLAPSQSGVPAVPDNAPFFIVGSPRSGTTLIQTILLGHSRLHIPPETHFIKDLVEKFPLATPLSREQAHAVVERIVVHERWRVMEIPADEFRAAAMALAVPRLADILNVFYYRHLRRVGKPRFGEKTPSYIEYVPQLLSIYPDARFIHLIRDGHDVAISLANMGWGQAYQGSRFPWTSAVLCGIGFKSMPFGNRILEVRYENMVRDLEGTVRRICAFIGEQFEPAMLDWHRNVEISVPTEERWFQEKLYQPILPDAVAVWRRKLSAIECFMIECSLYRELERTGYDLRFGSIFWRPALFSVGAAMRRLAPLLDRAIPALRRRNYLRRPLYI